MTLALTAKGKTMASHTDEQRERGASLVEYALLLALIAAVCIVAVTALGTNLSDSYGTTNHSLFGG
jgi:pilus assembly protein Flp/PilA